jgi:hypothetical protein
MPAIAKTPITKIKIVSESITNENELNRVLTIIFRALTFVIVLKGLRTRIALKALTEKPISTTRGSKLVKTIIKSKIFQRSLR